jgi:hypothetical protein
MKISEVIKFKESPVQESTSGSTSTGSIATVPGVGTGNKVGTLFGGTYKQKKTKRTK